MSKLAKEEMETHVSRTALDEAWEVYTDDPRFIKKFQSLGAEFVRDLGFGKVFKLTDDMLVLRKKPKGKAVTEKQKNNLKKGV